MRQDQNHSQAQFASLLGQIRACNHCAGRFAATVTAHQPRPVVRGSPQARILICGQAPGMRVHETGLPFNDRSGDRLREWMGADRAAFYDETHIAILPMAFCFPGYDKNGSDLPPPRICADLWRRKILDLLPKVELILLVGGYAQKWHLGTRESVTETVRRWREIGPDIIPLPHPSWRNTGWLRNNPWFEAELLPILRREVNKALR